MLGGPARGSDALLREVRGGSGWSSGISADHGSLRDPLRYPGSPDSHGAQYTPEGITAPTPPLCISAAKQRLSAKPTAPATLWP